MTKLCTLLPAYLDGTLPEDQAERFEIHAAECAECDAALVLPADLGDALSSLAHDACPPDVLASVIASTQPDWPEAWSHELRGLADAACPPEVVDAALRRTRRAPDRAPTRSPRRALAGWAVGLAALLAVALAWNLRPESAPPQLEIAEVTPPPAPPPPAPVQELIEAETVAEPDADPRSQPTPAPPPVRPADPEPEQVAQVQEATPAPSSEAEDLPTDQEIQAAQQDLALAFTLIDDAQSQARSRLRDEAGPLSTTLDQTLPF